MKHELNSDYDKNAEVARWRTAQYQDRLEQTRNILLPALAVKHAIDCEKLVDEYLPIDPQPITPTYLKYPPEPQKPSVIDEH